MKKKILLLSITAAAILVLTSFTSAVSSNTTPKHTPQAPSPLFTIRQHQKQNQHNDLLNTNYLGKGKILNLFLEKQFTYTTGLHQALQMLERNPVLFKKLITYLEHHPRVQAFIEQSEISKIEFTNYANQLKNNPAQLAGELKKIQQYLPPDAPIMPTGLNDTSGIALLILILVLLPVLLLITVVIATATIITCLNLGGCFESLFENLVVGFFQGLTPA